MKDEAEEVEGGGRGRGRGGGRGGVSREEKEASTPGQSYIPSGFIRRGQCCDTGDQQPKGNPNMHEAAARNAREKKKNKKKKKKRRHQLTTKKRST
jgi:hypothetical protein